MFVLHEETQRRIAVFLKKKLIRRSFCFVFFLKPVCCACLSFPHGAPLPAESVLHVAFRSEYHLTFPFVTQINCLIWLYTLQDVSLYIILYFASSVSLCADKLKADLVPLLSEGEQKLGWFYHTDMGIVTQNCFSVVVLLLPNSNYLTYTIYI